MSQSHFCFFFVYLTQTDKHSNRWQCSLTLQCAATIWLRLNTAWFKYIIHASLPVSSVFWQFATSVDPAFDILAHGRVPKRLVTRVYSKKGIACDSLVGVGRNRVFAFSSFFAPITNSCFRVSQFVLTKQLSSK